MNAIVNSNSCNKYQENDLVSLKYEEPLNFIKVNMNKEYKKKFEIF